MNIVVDAVVGGTILGAAYGIAGVVFGLLYRIVKVFHFAFAAIGTCGAYVAVTIAGSSTNGLTIALGVVCGMVLAGVLTALSYFAVYRPIIRRGATSGTTFVSSLAIGLIVEAGLVIVIGPASSTFNLGGFDVDKTFFSILHVSGLNGLAILLLVVVTLVCVWFMKRTAAGRQTEAIISNIEQAEIVGIRTGMMTVLLCFGLGALSVLAFVLQAMNSTLSIEGGVPLALFGVLAMLCGGVSNIWGTAVAGLLIGVVDGVAATFVPGQWADTIVFVVAVIIVLIRPGGAGLRTAAA